MTFGLSRGFSPLEKNICYINAIIQLLNSVAMIRNLVKKKGYRENLDSVTPVLDELSRIFNYQGAVTSAGPLRQLLGSREGLTYVTLGEQEDASLFLSQLLEQMIKEVSPDIQLEKLLKMSVIQQPCFSTPEGKCSNCRYTPQPREDSFNVLTLQEYTGSNSLQDLIEYYLKDQTIEIRCGNDGLCKDADAKKMKPGVMTHLVTEVPEILFLQVPKTVDAKACDGFFHVQDVRFEIVGVVDHLGHDLNSGHYITWAKCGSEWTKFDDNKVESDQENAHFSSNNYIFVGIQSIDNDEGKQRCISCGNSFSSLLQHLNKSSNCQVYYDLEAMKVENKLKRREKEKQQLRKKRSNQSVHETEIQREKNTQCRKQARDKLPKSKKDELRKNNTEERQKARGKLPEQKAKKIKSQDAKNKKLVWDLSFAKNNKTTTGRKRIFLNLIRDGCSYPCFCCQEAKYRNGVKEIVDMVKYKEELDEKYENFFAENIWPCSSVTQDVLKKICNRKGSFFLCHDCKSKLDKGKTPAKCRSNKLEIFDINDYPDLDLTELELNLISKKIIFMKIHRKPKSQMSAIKDRIVCIPIDSGTIEDTLQKLPRLPKEAGLVPIKLKRKQAYKSPHLQEWVDVDKVHRCLLLLKNFGHSEYQFYSPEDFNSYVSRCKVEDKEGYEMLFDPAEYEMSIDDDSLENQNVDDPENMETESEAASLKLGDEDEALDEIEYAEKLEEDYRLNDPCAKFQFNYDQTACFVNDSPETGVMTHDNNEAISVSPGEGKNCTKLSFKFENIFSFQARFLCQY